VASVDGGRDDTPVDIEKNLSLLTVSVSTA
jgi:hypothetical protein